MIFGRCRSRETLYRQSGINLLFYSYCLMRLSLHLSENVGPVPYNHLETLTRVLRRWLDHDLPTRNGVGLYSFGWLHGARENQGHLVFEHGATWRISFYHKSDALRALAGTKNAPDVAFGMQVEKATLQPPPAFDDEHRFLTDLGPIITRRRTPDGRYHYLLWRDHATDDLMTASLRRKLARIGLPGNDLVARVAFDRTYRKAHSKLTTVHGVEHRGSICPVIIEGSREAHTLAWTTGVGDLNEYGFGALR